MASLAWHFCIFNSSGTVAAIVIFVTNSMRVFCTRLGPGPSKTFASLYYVSFIARYKKNMKIAIEVRWETARGAIFFDISKCFAFHLKSAAFIRALGVHAKCLLVRRKRAYVSLITFSQTGRALLVGKDAETISPAKILNSFIHLLPDKLIHVIIPMECECFAFVALKQNGFKNSIDIYLSNS